MTHMKRFRMMVCVLVANTLMVTLLSGSAFAASAEDGRRIVTFRGLDLTTLLGYLTALGLVTASGSTVVHKLKFINALAIKLPLANITGALLTLLHSPLAGIIGAKLNGRGIEGVAPLAKVVPVKVLNENGSGHLSDLLRGMEWVYDSDIRLTNMSLQFRENHRPLEQATKRLYERGVIMVAAAGNHCSSGPPDEGGDGDDGGDGDPSETDVAYPAAYSTWVIPVGATDYYNRVTAYSRSGQAMAIGGVVAPGGSQATHIRILSTSLDGGYGYGSGTSPAAAHVSGVLALALELRPQLSFEEAVDFLKVTARNLGYPATEQGAGLIDAAELVEALQ